MTLDELTSKVFQKVKPASRPVYLNAWTIFTKLAKVKTLDDLRKITGLKLDRTREQFATTYKPATVALILAVVRRVVRTGVLHEVLVKDITVGVRSPIGDNVPHWNVLQPGELEKLAKVLKKGSMERAIILALTLQGLRVSEMCSRTWGDVGRDKDGPTLQVRGKGDKFRVLGLQQEVLDAALGWGKGGMPTANGDRVCWGHSLTAPFIRGPQGKRLTRGMVTGLVARLSQEHLGHRVTAHGLRATFISDVISRHGIERARQLARHSSIISTQKYSRWVSIRDDPKVLR